MAKILNNRRLLSIAHSLQSYARTFKNGKTLDIAPYMRLLIMWNSEEPFIENRELVAAVFKLKGMIKGKLSAESSKSHKLGTKCWTCVNGCPTISDGRYISGCNYSLHQKPVPGWTADKYVTGYHVFECPKYVKGRYVTSRGEVVE